jgi:hypothetical protein
VKAALELSDDFTDRRPEGAVLGTRATSGQARLGADVEGVLSIDDGALRIAPLVESGFGRVALAYGPFPSRPGLAFAVYMLNGHNTAQAEPLSDTFSQRFDLWLRGSRAESRKRRLLQWLRSGRIGRTLRQFRRWKRAEKGGRAVPPLDENLAVGWFPAPDTPDPRVEGSAFIMHALGPENGELRAGGPRDRVRVLRGVQNLPFYFVAVIRGGGVLYYAASLEEVPGLTPHPWLRPLAIESGSMPDPAYLGIHQGVLGQIGWRIDTRVHGVRVARLPGYDAWWGGAHAADRLPRGAPADGDQAETGGRWLTVKQGEQAVIACLDPGAPSSLVHAVAKPGADGPGGVGLVWRYQDEKNHWRVQIGASACEVICVEQGSLRRVAARTVEASPAQEHRLQVIDDGRHQMAYLDGEPMLDAWLTDARLGEATKVGVVVHDSAGRGGALHSFEAHPRRVALPEIFDMGKPWLRKGSRVVAADDFSGERADLDGRKMPVGGATWRRMIGDGIIEVTGKGFARVRGSPSEPCPGRTAYCVDWPHPEFVDLEAIITPPGQGPGPRDMTTAGFILYRDPRNYVTLNAYRADTYAGGSVSTFFRLDGFEDIYDAVWSNVGGRVTYGKPLRLRLCCDGERYVVFIDEEPVLYRAFRDVYPNAGRLQLRHVGIVANWEFGTDTGSTFEQLRLRV